MFFKFFGSIWFYRQNGFCNRRYTRILVNNRCKKLLSYSKTNGRAPLFLFSKEYGVPVKIARLTQTTGAGIAPDDNRIIAQFARKAVKSEDIILHTLGKSARPYCYTTDAISAIIYILLKGENGEPYNVANPDTYVSARDLADYVKTYFNPDINVRIEIADNMGYAPDSYLPLSTEKLEKLGWKPKYGLYEIFKNLIDCMSTDKGLNRYHF